jgi:hypothetical protein
LLWSLLVYVGKSPSVDATDLAVFLLAGSGTGIAVSYIFRSAFRRARLPWALFLPLATVPASISIFAGLIWAVEFGFGHRSVTGFLEILSNLCTALLFLWPVVYLIAFINQWVLQRVLLNRNPGHGR